MKTTYVDAMIDCLKREKGAARSIDNAIAAIDRVLDYYNSIGVGLEKENRNRDNFRIGSRSST